MQTYSDPSREDDAHALPDIEVWCHDGSDDITDDEGEPMPAGFYWWSCFPGCLPDSEPFGPYDTEAEALADAQDLD